MTVRFQRTTILPTTPDRAFDVSLDVDFHLQSFEDAGEQIVGGVRAGGVELRHPEAVQVGLDADDHVLHVWQLLQEDNRVIGKLSMVNSSRWFLYWDRSEFMSEFLSSEDLL